MCMQFHVLLQWQEALCLVGGYISHRAEAGLELFGAPARSALLCTPDHEC